MPKYEVRERPWSDAFKRRRFPELWKRVGLQRPWGLYKDGLIIGTYETREEAEAIRKEVEAIEAARR